ncbi:methyl-accepting chemotaxis protein [Noviherbaspirillum aridicola]|uniref:Methyl-accepting chemotaxis protein n=1 Tax=Noviherbaspirillum aridicola TaxID=2849687 RepID=A0ABQ4PZF8_9BURK|nr:methyl-accepting chemotaxis protein [Noviherbaspirillum aridicola]GIZ50210.1 methyl-accepting chemotaxis protein [Noviherbaspirillum aridicola]
MKLRDLKLGTRLGLGFGLVLLLMVALVAIALIYFQGIGRMTSDMIEKDWLKAEAAHTVNATVRANARRTMELFVVTEQAQRDRVLAKIEENKKTITDALTTLDRLVERADAKAILVRIREERAQYVKSFTQVSKLIAEDRRDEAGRMLIADTLPALDRLQESVKELSAVQTQVVQETGTAVRNNIASARNVMLALGVIAVIIGVVFAVRLTLGITRPLRNAVRVAETVAAGDLTSVIDVDSRDETGQLLQALKQMNGNLEQMVAKVRNGTDTIATASVQIAAGNLDLSSRTEQQAASLEETASSMEQLTSAVRQNADHAREANALAEAASRNAGEGSRAIGEVNATMSAINDSARKIADITSLIDGIAFQTNILALNAAVEAARAGEQGRGFAVVASEVRSLAQRAGAAAREIRQLIADSTGQCETGARQVEQAAATMAAIVDSVRRVTEIMGHISQASNEQSTGIEQVNIAIAQMDEVTQQNAALVEQAAAAAGALEDQASGLTQLVGAFRLEQRFLALPA